MTVISVAVGALGTGSLKAGNKTTRRNGYQTKNQVHPPNRIIKICKNTQKSPGDFRRTCNHSESCKRPSAFIDVKNSQEI